MVTANGGQHLHFRAGGHPIGSTFRRPSPPGPGCRSGGYLVGSVVAGRPYVLLRDTAIRDLPAWLAALLTRPATVPNGRQATGRAGQDQCLDS